MLRDNKYRDCFHLPKKDIYLSNHSTGCLPHKTREALNDCMQQWASSGTDAWLPWLDELNAFESALALMFDGEPNEFCLQTNVSSALVKIIGSLPKRKGRTKILISDEDFPSIRYVAEQAVRLGYEIDVLSSVNGQFTIDAWKEKINETVQMVFITHVLPRNNFRNDIDAIVSYANSQDVFSVVDIAQSAGIVPISMKKLNAHFVISNCLKWLCGGPGSAFLWANQQSIELFNPIDTGWFSKDNPFDTSGAHFKYASNARRFMGGTPSIFPCLIARHSIDVLNEIGVDVIYKHNQSLCSMILDSIKNKSFNLQTSLSAQERGGTLCFKFKNPLYAFNFLAENGFITDSTKIVNQHSNMRISPHIYNEQEEIEKLIECLDVIHTSGNA